MANFPEAGHEIIELLQRTDTCSVSNAIETLELRLRNEGFIHDVAKCQFPDLPPVAGYAVPGRMRSSAPPMAGRCYYSRLDWWEYIAQIPAPRIIVMEDIDRNPGTGALFGEMHATIARSLGCVAYVSNGSIRDLPALRNVGLQCFSHGPSVSHSYAHVVEYGQPITIGGLVISPGDLLHGDMHGVHSIPLDAAATLPEALEQLRRRESQLLELCRAPGFTVEKLSVILKEDSSPCPPNRPW